MKKRILSIVFVILLLIPCFTLTASADTCDISLWDDFKTLRHNGALYTRFDSSMTEWEYDYSYNGVTYDIDEVKYVDYNVSVNDAIIEAYIYLKDGSSIHASYISENYLDEYVTISQNAAFYEVEFELINTHTIAVSAQYLIGNQTTLTDDKISHSEHFAVNASTADDSFYVKKGILALIDDEYYYVSYAENDYTATIDFWDIEGRVLTAHKITDPDLLTKFDAAYNEYNNDLLDFGEGNFAEAIGTVFLCIAFGLVPLTALILFLILALRAKTPAYKKLFNAIWITAATEFVVFVVTIILLTVL